MGCSVNLQVVIKPNCQLSPPDVFLFPSTISFQEHPFLASLKFSVHMRNDLCGHRTSSTRRRRRRRLNNQKNARLCQWQCSWNPEVDLGRQRSGLGVIRRWASEERSSGEYLVNDYRWKVRKLIDEDENEIRQVVRIQSHAFHQPVALFDRLFFQFFQAEVLSGLLYKLRNSPPNRYACLVAMATASSESLLAQDGREELVGVVDVTVLRDEAVLQHLEGAEEYLYVSGIAVSESYRRQKIGTALLKACDALSIQWGCQYLALRAYEDDVGARKLYSNAGYAVVSSDPPWVEWIGKKRRVLMIKKSTSSTTVDDY